MTIDPVENLRNVLQSVIVSYSRLESKQRSETSEYSYDQWLEVIGEIDEIFETIYPTVFEDVQMAFSSDQSIIINYFNEIKSMSYEKKESSDWDYLILLVGAYLSTQSLENWSELLRPMLLYAMVSTGLMWARRLNMETSADILTTYISASDWFNNYVLKFAQQVSSTTEVAIRQIIQEGADLGWGIDRIRNQISFLFETWITGIDPSDPDYQWLLDRTPFHRTQMIARTELNRAMNSSSHQQFVNWNVPMHLWFTALDERVRDSHSDIHGQTQLINVPFTTGLGNKLLYPCDPDGPPEDVINCRCSEIPIYTANEAQNLVSKHD